MRELGVTAGADALFYDIPVIGGTDNPEGNAVLRKREDEGRSHHSESYNSYCLCHILELGVQS